MSQQLYTLIQNAHMLTQQDPRLNIIRHTLEAALKQYGEMSSVIAQYPPMPLDGFGYPQQIQFAPQYTQQMAPQQLYTAPQKQQESTGGCYDPTPIVPPDNCRTINVDNVTKILTMFPLNNMYGFGDNILITDDCSTVYIVTEPVDFVLHIPTGLSQWRFAPNAFKPNQKHLSSFTNELITHVKAFLSESVSE